MLSNNDKSMTELTFFDDCSFRAVHERANFVTGAISHRARPLDGTATEGGILTKISYLCLSLLNDGIAICRLPL